MKNKNLKNLIAVGILAISASVSLSSCEKADDLTKAAVDQSAVAPMSRGNSGPIYLFEYTPSQWDHRFRCDAPGTSCSKVYPDPSPGTNKMEAEPWANDFKEFTEAIAKNTTKEFFKTIKYQSFFSQVTAKTRLGLTTGALVVRKFSNGDSEVYGVVPANNQNPENIIVAVEAK